MGAWDEIGNLLVEISCVDAELGDVAAHVRPHMNGLQPFVNTIEQTTETTGLITVFDAILTGRQSGPKLQCLYGNSMANNFFQN